MKVELLPPLGSLVRKDDRVCEVETLDSAGSYYLIDCLSNLDDAEDERNVPFPVTPEELATWKVVAPPPNQGEPRAA